MSVPYRDAGSNHRIHDWWIPHKKEPYKFKKVRRKHNGRWNAYGELRALANGSVYYWALRRFDEACIDCNGWAIDISTVRLMHNMKVTHFGVLVKETKQEYVVTAEFLDFGKLIDVDAAKVIAVDRGVTFHDYSKHVGKRGMLGTKQWGIPFDKWIHAGESAVDIGESMRV